MFDKEELLLGIAFSCRGTRVQREDLIVGDIARLLPVRCCRGMDVEQYRDAVAEAGEHATTSIVEIYDMLGITSDVMHISITTNIIPKVQDNKECLYFNVQARDTSYMPNCVIMQDEEGLSVRISYNSLAFSKEWMDSFEEKFIKIVDGMLENI